MINFVCESSEDLDPVADLFALVNRIKASAGPSQPHYYALRKWELKAALKFFKNTNVIVHDNKGNTYIRGKKVKEKGKKSWKKQRN